MSKPDDFETLFHRLGVAQLPKSANSQTTFLPGVGDTLVSSPKEEFHALDSALTSTLPKLELASPDAARSAADEPELLPFHIIGEGGMGQVLLAQQTALGRKVAVKVLKPALASRAAADALVQEARTAGGLEHPGVVPIYALARDAQGLPALVMKRVEGLSWRELMHAPEHSAWQKLLPSGRDRLAFHVEVLVQVCNAVAHAHQRHVLHRDVKPANVLLGELGEVYLADWGVAISRSANAGGVRLVGTPAYLAPEMVTGDAAKMDERTDVYLLGATLHEALTGEPPHGGADLREVLEHAFEAPEPVLPPGTPPLLAAACKRALAADPAKRFPSATALRDELKRYLQHRGSTALAQAATERLGELEAVGVEAGEGADERRWNALVFECRFGFAQALKDSPDHAEARDGLRRCLEVAARHEIARGAPAAARAFFAELEAPPPELRVALEALEVKEAQRTQDAARLRRLTHELDPQVAMRQRMLLVLGMSMAIGLMVAFFAVAPTLGIALHYDGWYRVVPISFVSGSYLLAALLGRRALFSTRINRELMGLLGVATFGMLAHRVTSILLEVPTHTGLALESVFLAAIASYGALTYHRGFFLSSLMFVGTAVGCGLLPEHAVNIFGFGTAAAIGGFSIVFGVWRREVGRREL